MVLKIRKSKFIKTLTAIPAEAQSLSGKEFSLLVSTQFVGRKIRNDLEKRKNPQKIFLISSVTPCHISLFCSAGITTY